MMAGAKAKRKATDRRTEERRIRNEVVQVERRVNKDQRNNPDRRR